MDRADDGGLGAAAAVQPSRQAPETGWIALDRGHTFDRLPEQLSARDRYRLNDLWQSAQFQQHLGAWLQIVTAPQNRLLAGEQPILRFLASCYPGGGAALAAPRQAWLGPLHGAPTDGEPPFPGEATVRASKRHA